MSVENVYWWRNGMVMVFDDKGEQVAALQGPHEEVREKVLAASNSATSFYRSNWGSGDKVPIRREEF